ncbi:helix-turn-helix domain-containing protein [Thioclava sp. BHET1]|nr:helix-turn-helix domain-containing protein [Thioclava sp. BHET1]
MTPAYPYTPDSLADRWGCSAETIRQMAKRGDLPFFKVGRMFRIPVGAVEKYECSNTRSEDSKGDLSSHGKMMPASATVSGLRPQQLGRLMQRRATS